MFEIRDIGLLILILKTGMTLANFSRFGKVPLENENYIYSIPTNIVGISYSIPTILVGIL